MICQDDASDRQTTRDADFRRIAFHLAGDGAEDYQSSISVVGIGGENDGGTTTCLLVSSLRIEGDLDDIAALRNVGGHLPHFLSHCRTRVHLGVEIVLRDLG
jgi:hypothetical protein